MNKVYKSLIVLSQCDTTLYQISTKITHSSKLIIILIDIRSYNTVNQIILNSRSVPNFINFNGDTESNRTKLSQSFYIIITY